MTGKRYKQLGKYIELVQERNKGAANANLMGVSIAKKFIPSIANIIGTDLSSYRIVHPGNFAFCPVTSRNGDKITIARYRGKEDCIISQAYLTFRVKDENELDPEYLMMWVARPEFDRYARFHSHGSVREIFSWEEMCNVYMPIPDIGEQRKIVAEYKTIEKSIENNNCFIKNLENTAKAIYHHTFVEGIDPENLPEGWKISTIENYFGNISIGKTPPREKKECFCIGNEGIKWVSIADMKEAVPFVFQTNESLTTESISKYGVKVIPQNTILLSFKMTMGRVAITTEKMCTNEAIAHLVCKDEKQLVYAYWFLKNFDFKELGSTSSITDAINSKIVKEIEIIVPKNENIESFARKVWPLLQYEYQLNRENLALSKNLSLLCSKLS